MIVEYIKPILYITGSITGLMIFQFLLPKLQAKMLKMDIPNAESRFFFAHWGILVFGFGVLLVLAANNEALRIPVMALAALEKAALVGWVIVHRKDSFAKALYPAAAFDTLNVVLFSWYILAVS